MLTSVVRFVHAGCARASLNVASAGSVGLGSKRPPRQQCWGSIPGFGKNPAVGNLLCGLPIGADSYGSIWRLGFQIMSGNHADVVARPSTGAQLHAGFFGGLHVDCACHKR